MMVGGLLVEQIISAINCKLTIMITILEHSVNHSVW